MGTGSVWWRQGYDQLTTTTKDDLYLFQFICINSTSNGNQFWGE